MSALPADVLYVEPPAVPAGMTLDAYRRRRPAPRRRRDILSLPVAVRARRSRPR